MSRRRLSMVQGSHFSAMKGGAQYQAEVLVDALVATDRFDVSYVTRNADPSFRPKGYRIVRLPTPGWMRRFGFATDAVTLTRTLGELAPDVIYQQGLKAHTGIAARYAHARGSKLVFHIASDFDVLPRPVLASMGHRGPSLLDKRMGEFGLRAADTVVAQTRVQAELLETHYGRTADAIVRNFHPVAEETLCKSDPVTVIWVANFKSVKRPELFVRLAKDLAATPARFVMIGRGGGTEFASLQAEIGAVSNLQHLGELSQDEVNRWVAQSHILVNTSLIEGFPNTFIQAWMRKVPVVTLGVNSDRLFDSDELGLCSDSYDALVANVGNLIGDRQRREAMGERAVAYANREHSMANVQKLIELLS